MRLARVVFASPIPIPGTHQRVQDFAEADGWEITDESGVLWLSRSDGVRWYTREPGSCIPKVETRATTPAPPPVAKGRR